ncbi:MAG: DUF2062 domain-containing protein [Fibrobacter sp.]|nr:DUF2062 domain-containing protein [Fibrobacter sp.]
MQKSGKKRRRLFRRLLVRFTIREKHLKGTAVHRLLGDYLFDKSLWIPSRISTAKGIAIGLFFGLQPIYGFQILCSIFLAFFLKGNISSAVLSTFISNPLTYAPLIVLQYNFGKWVMNTGIWKNSPLNSGTPGPILAHTEPVIIGSVLSGITVSFIGFAIVALLWYEIGVLVVKIRELHKKKIHH